MKTYHQPSGLSTGIEFLIDANWTPRQAFAVIELLDDLRDKIAAHYQSDIFDLLQEERAPALPVPLEPWPDDPPF
nr:hypothetical protein [uncultured Rhodopila sp.]